MQILNKPLPDRVECETYYQTDAEDSEKEECDGKSCEV
jgi:hypothetical protein